VRGISVESPASYRAFALWRKRGILSEESATGPPVARARATGISSAESPRRVTRKRLFSCDSEGVNHAVIRTMLGIGASDDELLVENEWLGFIEPLIQGGATFGTDER
jgi:hypothetical protein